MFATLKDPGTVVGPAVRLVDAAGAPVTADAAGVWTGTFAKGTLADGAHVVEVSETDGKTGQNQVFDLSFTLDTTPPPVAVALKNDTGTSKTDNITKDPTLAITSDPNTTLQVSIDGGAQHRGYDGCRRNRNVPEVGLIDGTHKVIVTSPPDLAGNIGTDC